MASFTEALRLVIDADTRGAVAEVNKFGAATARELGKSEKSLDKWGSRLSSVGVGMVAFGAAAVAGLGALAMQSEKANLSQVKLQNTIDNMPRLAGESAKQFTDLADSIQDVTAADADAIVEAEALLGTFQLTADQIKDITPLVVDYARKFGIDMADAAVQVGKALDGQVGALKRNGVSIDETLFKTDRYRAVQEALSDQVGGFAEAEGATFAGSLERLKNQLGDLAEGVGAGAVDAFSKMFGAVEDVAGALESVSPGTQNLIGQVATFGAVALIAVGGLSTLVGKLLEARATFQAARIAAAEFGITLKTLAIGGAVVGGLIAIRTVLGDINDELDRADMSRLENQLLKLGRTGSVTGDVLNEALNKIFEGTGPEGLARGRQAVKDLDDALASLAARDPKAAAAAFAFIVDKAKEAGLTTGQVKEGFDAYTAAVTEAETANQTTGAAIDETTGEIEAQAGVTDQATEAVKSYSDELRGLFDPLFGAVNAQQQLAEANADVIGKEMELAAAIQEHGEGSLEAMAATDALRQAQLDAAAAALGQEAALSQLKDAVDNGTVSVEDAKTKLQQWVAQGLITQESADITAGKFDELAGEADSVPDSVNVGVTTTGIQVVNTDIANLKAKLDSIPRSVNTEIITTFKSFFSGGRQHGGPVRAGEAYIVGEKQAELFVPNQNGTVLPEVPDLVSMRAGGAGGSGGGTVTLVIDSGSNPVDKVLADILRRTIRIEHGGNVQAALGFSR